MPTRRTFLKHAAAGSLAAVAAPAVRSVALQPPGGAAPPIVGSGEHQYEAIHQWLRLPDKYSWQTTHNIAVDSQGLVYVIHEGRLDQPEHPAIFVFAADGAFVRAFGNQFQGGGHGLDVHREGSEEFLYVTAYKEKRSFAKLTLRGETVWHKSAPIEAGRYRAGEEALEHPGGEWLGRDRFLPTNFAFHPEGGFFLADGYGAYCVHRYDADANYVSTFGKPSDEAKANGTFDTPHGIWLDGRAKPQAVGAGPVEPQLVVADRANGRLQWFTLQGEHRQTQTGFLLPANVDVRGDMAIVPDLVGRVTLLDAENQVVAHLGDDSTRMAADERRAIRGNPSQWQPGKFVHPHDACFDAEGNIYVAEWVHTGRVTKLRKLS